jgi:hypothetical protein
MKKRVGYVLYVPLKVAVLTALDVRGYVLGTTRLSHPASASKLSVKTSAAHVCAGGRPYSTCSI